jgi:hypothetical protein
MSISKENILKFYKPEPIDEKLIDKSAIDIFDLLLVKESQPPNKEKKDIKPSNYYIITNEDNWHKINSNPNIEFNRGGNFKPKEEIIDIKIENIYLFNNKFNIPTDNKTFYTKNSNYNNFMGPFSSKEIEEQYKNKRININSEFRPIDIFMFNNIQPFSFQNFKILNDEKWIDDIEDNAMLKYSILFKTSQKLINNSEINIENNQTDKKIENKIEEKKEEINNQIKQEEINKEIKEEKNNEKENKEEDKKEEDKKEIQKEENKKDNEKQKEEEKKIEKKENKTNYIRADEGEWEDPNKKKNKRKQKEREREKEKEQNKTPIGIATKKDIKISQANTLIKDTNNVDDLLNDLKPKNKKENETEKIPIENYYNENEFKQKKNKNKKKKKIYEANIETGFKY